MQFLLEILNLMSNIISQQLNRVFHLIVMRNLFFFFLVVLVFGSCKHSGEYKKVMHDPLLYSQTVHELNNIVMGNNFTPVVASRNYTYANIAAYEVIAAGDSKHYHSLAGQLHGLTRRAKNCCK